MKLQAQLPTLSGPQLEQAAAEVRRILWTAQNEPLRFFVLHGGQEALLDEICRPGGYVIGTGAGNGWGKSKFVVAFLAAVMFPSSAPASFTKHDLIANWPHPKRARIISTPKEVEEIGSIQTAIQELFPKGQYEAKSKSKNYPSQYKTSTGWIVDVMTYEQDKGEFAGPDIGLTIFNEPMPEAIWKESLIRARAGGIILFAMTSLLENPWVVDGILSKADGGDIRVRYGSSEENCKQHGKNGHIDHDQLEKILAQYEPDEREARRTGKPLSMSGRIFKRFDQAVHCVPEIVPPASGVSYGLSIDPAIGKPMYILFRYVDGAGVVHYYDEYPSDIRFQGAKDSSLTLKDYAEIIRSKMQGHAFDSLIIDRHFAGARRNMGGKTFLAEFQEHFPDMRASYTLASDEIETGINKIKEYLAWDQTKERSALNRPRILISKTGCPNLVTSLERWGRDQRTGKPLEDFKDPVDALRYDLMSNPAVEVARDWGGIRQAHYGVGNLG